MTAAASASVSRLSNALTSSKSSLPLPSPSTCLNKARRSLVSIVADCAARALAAAARKGLGVSNGLVPGTLRTSGNVLPGGAIVACSLGSAGRCGTRRPDNEPMLGKLGSVDLFREFTPCRGVLPSHGVPWGSSPRGCDLAAGFGMFG
eukprot:CAMPEP_0115870008 /NCGR_PEP_ID=MMETSP0287-20121206/22099_1 /TAXON_ID=412157 /ORGANISM="Chrysochromulina rotalis, Strain UIO044" /LENGTH=147 /DNA_ID=CAMNT_0003324705 /DNA_START=475 /DNA_END=918 /DNA_ORIENTATION=-